VAMFVSIYAMVKLYRAKDRNLIRKHINLTFSLYWGSVYAIVKLYRAQDSIVHTQNSTKQYFELKFIKHNYVLV